LVSALMLLVIVGLVWRRRKGADLRGEGDGGGIESKPESTHSDWYNIYYREAGSSEQGPWYKGVFKVLAREFPSGLADKKVLEIGCGTGSFVGSLQSQSKFGLDPSPEACRIAVANGVSAIVGIGERVPARNETFDVIICCEVLEHSLSPQRLLNETARVLKKDGLLVISFPNYSHPGWLGLRLLSDLFKRPGWVVKQPVDRILTIGRVAKLLRRAGFSRRSAIGEVLEPPGLYHLRRRSGKEPIETERFALLSFHPVLGLRKSRAV
jgi:SAM-dependent methyltransferase